MIRATTDPDWTVASDASRKAHGWREVTNNDLDSPVMGAGTTHHWPIHQDSLHRFSAFAEVRGLARAALQYVAQHDRRQGRLLLVTDSMCAMSAINKMGATKINSTTSFKKLW